MKLVFATFVLILSSISAFSQAVPAGFDLSNYGVKIEPDKRVILVLAALDAARTENEKGETVPLIKTGLSEQGEKFRELLKSDLVRMDERLRQRISTFVQAHKRRNPNLSDAEMIAPFISMAYALSPAPDLSDPIVTADLPGNLLDVLDFAPLVRELYRTTNIGANLNEYVKQYTAASEASVRPSARVMVNELLGYLHTRPQLAIVERVKTETLRKGSKKEKIQKTETRERPRQFVIVPEMLAPDGYVNFVNIKDDYYAVIPPDTDLTNSEVRRAYLQFVVDPLVLGHAKDIEAVRPGIKQLLDERRKTDPKTTPDVYLTVSRSLVAAIDAKQIEHSRVTAATSLARSRIAAMGGSDPTKKVALELEKLKQQASDETIFRLSEDYEKGAVLVFYFADQLVGLENSETDIASSIREMILSIDAAKETGRYESYAEARKRAKAARDEQKTNASAAPSFIENPVTTRLLEIQETIKTKNYAKAEADLKQLLEKNPSEPRIYFNIGRLAAISAELIDGDTEAEKQKAKYLEAKTAFENVIRIAQAQAKNPSGAQVDRALVSLAYVSLGRIYEHYDQKQYAVAIYDAAIKLGEIPGGGYREAVDAKQRLLKDQ